MEWAWTENIKKNFIGQFIEKQSQHFPTSGSKTEYHAQVRGLILNEVFRRVDIKHRTLSEFIRDEIQIKGLYLGATQPDNQEPLPQTLMSKAFVLKQSLTPEWTGLKKISITFDQVVKAARTSKNFSKMPPSFQELEGKGFGQEFVNFYNSAQTSKAEISSVNFRGNARGCAKLASIMANKGKGLMSEEAWNEMHAEPKRCLGSFSKSE